MPYVCPNCKMPFREREAFQSHFTLAPACYFKAIYTAIREGLSYPEFITAQSPQRLRPESPQRPCAAGAKDHCTSES